MSSSELKVALLEELEFAKASGLKSSNLWANGRPIRYVEDAYFVQDVPVVYFSRLDPNSDPETIWELYRSVWSQSKVPLLYVILPTEIRIYNSYVGPSEEAGALDKGGRLLRVLKKLENIEAARRRIRDQLSNYKRFDLETGTFWNTPDGQRIKREKRADQRLLAAMDQARRRLTNPENGHGLSNDLAYALLGRSIFIRYLEARGVLDVSELTDGRAKDYIAALDTNDAKNVTYLLFERLSERFNGDLFPVDNHGREREQVQQSHLNILKEFLRADKSQKGKVSQLSLWPYYDFEHIPIELISGIYDTFLYNDTGEGTENEKKRRKLGAYYTPLPLVEFVVEETLPLDKTRSEMTILDPACGSGVFLVRAYQRLVAAWKFENNNQQPTAETLSALLKKNIFGVDKEVNAVQIAAFSLYLAMLDYLEDAEIKKQSFRFPGMKDTNLITADFFSKKVDSILSHKIFDRVLGNPPWGRGTLTEDASQWLEEHNYKIAGKQIVQAFLLRAPDFCAEDGEIALLAPVKSTILVSGPTYIAYRRRFFERYHVRAVVNLSVLRHELFVSSVSPAAAIFYQPQPSSLRTRLIYGVPKPSALSQRLGAIVLDTTEIKFLDREELLVYPVLWKIASWGSPRDAALVERLQAFPTLRQQSKKLQWKIDEGFMAEYKGSDKNKATWLKGLPFVSTEQFLPYLAEPHGVVEADIFHRPRTRETYQAPLVLIHKSKCQAAFSAIGVAYTSSITGVRGDVGQEDNLKWLAAYICSPLGMYYQFLTSSRWAVERDTPVQGEYEDMPFLLPDRNDPRFKKILGYFDDLAVLYQQRYFPLSSMYDSDIQKIKSEIDELVFDIYKISSIERRLVQDMVEYEIDFFYWVERKRRKIDAPDVKGIQRPDPQMLAEYARVFTKTVTTFLRYQNQTLNATVYHNGAPLSIVEFELVALNQAQEVEFIESSQELVKTLRALDHLLLEQQAPTLYARRHVRIFAGSQFSLVRPSERRFWTLSQAYTDADGFIADMLAYSTSEAGVSR